MKFEDFEMSKFYYFNGVYYYFLQLIFFSCVSGLKEAKSSILCGWMAHWLTIAVFNISRCLQSTLLMC
jgi:hypothetical protein